MNNLGTRLFKHSQISKELDEISFSCVSRVSPRQKGTCSVPLTIKHRFLKLKFLFTAPLECWDREDRDNKGSSYRGTKSETVTGDRCLNWANELHSGNYYRENVDL